MSTEEQQEDRDLQMMQDDTRWPVWPLLPLKRWNAECRQPEHGFLHAADARAVLYFGSIFALAPGYHLTKLPQKEFPSLEALRAEGWVVD